MLELEMGKDVALMLSKHLLMYGKFYQNSYSVDSEVILYVLKYSGDNFQ